jgi:hypothetical protein
MDVPDNSIVFNEPKHGIAIKSMTEQQIKERTSVFWRWG